jgi:hypothetical protein
MRLAQLSIVIVAGKPSQEFSLSIYSCAVVATDLHLRLSRLPHPSLEPLLCLFGCSDLILDDSEFGAFPYPRDSFLAAALPCELH